MVGESTVALLNPVVGVQAYVSVPVPPVAVLVRVIAPVPTQYSLSDPQLTVMGLVLTVMLWVFEQPVTLLVVVTV